MSVHFNLVSKVWMLSLAVAVTAHEYCEFSPNHELCDKNSEPSQCDGPLIESGFTTEQIEEMVKVHNDLRCTLALGEERRGFPGPQPPASNMLQMAWDPELAQIAQKHADRCNFAHNCNECRQTERFSVGQNLWTASNTRDISGPESVKVIKAFYDEVTQFNGAGVERFGFSASTGHYTQVVWAESGMLGCGYAKWKEGSWYKKIIVCNYGPAGNFMKRPVYIVGEPCSQCPEGTECSLQHPGLCAGTGELRGRTRVCHGRSGGVPSPLGATVKQNVRNQATRPLTTRVPQHLRNKLPGSIKNPVRGPVTSTLPHPINTLTPGLLTNPVTRPTKTLLPGPQTGVLPRGPRTSVRPDLIKKSQERLTRVIPSGAAKTEWPKTLTMLLVGVSLWMLRMH